LALSSIISWPSSDFARIWLISIELSGHINLLINAWLSQWSLASPWLDDGGFGGAV
jgi:hypothetical protein